VFGFDWVWLGLGLLADISSYRRRPAAQRHPGYPQTRRRLSQTLATREVPGGWLRLGGLYMCQVRDTVWQL
jgi:hypothetical protein